VGAYNQACPPGFAFDPGADFSDEAQVRQFGAAVHEDDVLRLDVAVSQTLTMKKIERITQFKADTQTFPGRQPSSLRPRPLTGQIARLIG